MLVFTTPLLAQVNCVTTPDQLGPYFIENAPIITNDTLAPGVNDTARALQLTFYRGKMKESRQNQRIATKSKNAAK